MPSHKIHIYIEEKLNEKLKLDEDLFKLGNVLPDLVNGKHSVAHFKVSKSEYDFNTFIDKYRKELDKKNPIVVGYLTHLLADEFYNRYVREKYFVYGEDKYPCGINKNGKIINMDRKKIFDIKHKDLENYDIYLLKHHKFKEFKNDNYNVFLFDVDKEEIKKYIKTYNNEIKNTESIIEEDYIMLEKEELNSIIEDVVNYIYSFLNNNIVIKSKKKLINNRNN